MKLSLWRATSCADGAIHALFADQPADDLTNEGRLAFFQVLRERIPSLFVASIWAVDPNDSTNRKQMPVSALRSLLKTGFVNAQRGLDDDTSRDTDVLAKILEGLFARGEVANADKEEQLIAQALQEAVSDIQKRIEGGFREGLRKLMPTLRNLRAIPASTVPSWKRRRHSTSSASSRVTLR